MSSDLPPQLKCFQWIKEIRQIQLQAINNLSKYRVKLSGSSVVK